MKVLITGFEPFGKETTNPSYEAVRLLPDEINGAKIVKAEIPVVFRKGGEEVQKLVRQENPDIVILVGQAGGRSAVTVERIAINCEDCPSGFPDNAGNSPQGEKIYEDGADGYFSNLPIKAMVKKMMDNDVPASVSNTAGTYVCNDLMYHLLYLIHQELPAIRGGFIHVPFATTQKHPNQPSMLLEQISKGLELSIEAALENEKDLCEAGGDTH